MIEAGCTAIIVNFKSQNKHLNGTSVYVVKYDQQASDNQQENVWEVEGRIKAFTTHGHPVDGIACIAERNLLRIDNFDFEEENIYSKNQELTS